MQFTDEGIDGDSHLDDEEPNAGNRITGVPLRRFGVIRNDIYNGSVDYLIPTFTKVFHTPAILHFKVPQAFCSVSSRCIDLTDNRCLEDFDDNFLATGRASDDGALVSGFPHPSIVLFLSLESIIRCGPKCCSRPLDANLGRFLLRSSREQYGQTCCCKNVLCRKDKIATSQ